MATKKSIPYKSRKLAPKKAPAAKPVRKPKAPKSTAKPGSKRVMALRKEKGLTTLHVFLEPKDKKKLTSIAKQHSVPQTQAARLAIRAFAL